ncbi:MAG TPA: hybrid sensor histidine kinase/response regulator [Polyangiaceae bacterium]
MDDPARLHRCIRDLAALQALPSLCVGRSTSETLDILVEALPTALGVDLVAVSVPGAPPTVRVTFRGREISPDALEAVRTEHALHCFEVNLPVGSARGTLVAGRTTPLDPAVDRVLVRSAANLVGTALEAANVLEAARRKDEFMAMLGHELRNPLAPILTAVELLARHPEVARERQVIERNTRHLTRLVDDLLDISRVTRGHVELRCEEVTLSSVLERAVEIAAPIVTRQRHMLHVGDASGILLRGDPVRLAQIFGNLLMNAAKFTAANGRVGIAVRREENRVRVSIEDNGRGIAREHLARIFEPFVQIDRQRDALGGGLGLGLAIVHNLIERHGGTISVKSEGSGHGTTFTVELPTVTHATTVPAAAVVHEQGPRQTVRVLVVDDNVDIAELVSLALQMEGFQTAVEHDARAALATWRTFAPHAAVLDVGLPELDGYDLAREIRAEHGRAPLLIAATGYGQPRDRERATDAGFDCHFVKPVSVQDLVSELDQRVVGGNTR